MKLHEYFDIYFLVAQAAIVFIGVITYIGFMLADDPDGAYRAVRLFPQLMAYLCITNYFMLRRRTK